jgi:predicted nucleic acid-binding protein
MVIVADTSPFNVLIQIEQIDVLPKLFGSVTIPTKVASELDSPMRSPAVRDFIQHPPPWLTIRQATNVEMIPGIHDGEREAISLARELNADLLLIDDADGRAAAIARGLATVRTLRLLTDAADRGLLELKSAFDKLTQTDFRFRHDTLDTLLREHMARKRKAR